MWSWYKPPITNWILLKFVNYQTKTILKKKFKNTLNLLVLEKNNIWLKQNFLFDKASFNNFFRLKQHFVCSLDSIYFIYMVNQTEVKDIKFSFSNFDFLILLTKLNLNCFFKLSLVNKKLSRSNSLSLNYSTIFLKNFIFEQKNFIFDKTLLNFWLFSYNFFYNSYFLFFLLNSKRKNSNKSSTWYFTKIYYYADKLSFMTTYDYFEKKINTYNKYISVQKGFRKENFFFINWHYLFSTSTQISKFSYTFFFKFFFKRIFMKLTLKKKTLPHQKNKKNNFKIENSGIFLWSRNLPILPNYINKIFYIHNGNWFFWLWVVPAMVGYKFGSFSFTRKILYKDSKILTLYKNI